MLEPWSAELRSLGGVCFTQREIDVMACILHVRGTSRIASLLSISPRTAETHTFNIMRKMHCNSREGIVDFVEKSGKCSVLRAHYYELSLYSVFYKKLKELSVFLRNKSVSCSLAVQSFSPKNASDGAIDEPLDEPLDGVSSKNSPTRQLQSFIVTSLQHIGFSVTTIEALGGASMPSQKPDPEWSLEQCPPGYLGCVLDGDLPIWLPVQDHPCLVFFELLKRLLTSLLPSLGGGGMEKALAAARADFQRHFENRAFQSRESSQAPPVTSCFFKGEQSIGSYWHLPSWNLKGEARTALSRDYGKSQVARGAPSDQWKKGSWQRNQGGAFLQGGRETPRRAISTSAQEGFLPTVCVSFRASSPHFLPLKDHWKDHWKDRWKDRWKEQNLKSPVWWQKQEEPLPPKKGSLYFPQNSLQPPTWFFTRQHLESVLRYAVFAFVLCFICFFGDSVRHRIYKISSPPLCIRSDLSLPPEDKVLKRPGLIAQLELTLNQASDPDTNLKAVALTGMGGAGKTTLARQYARLWVQKHKTPVVWELNGETGETLLESFENLAYALSETPQDLLILQKMRTSLSLKERAKRVLFWVRKKLTRRSQWLLIYDNVGKVDELWDFFPRDAEAWGNGRIIATTRDENIRTNPYIGATILVPPLTPQEKLSLFASILAPRAFSPHSGKQKVNNFLQKIASFPLDVSLAAYYLKASQSSLDDYDHARLATDFSPLQEMILRETSGYTNTRIRIVTLALDQLLKAHKDFAELLLCVSLLDAHNIPLAFLEKIKEKTVVENFIYHLKKYSLLLPPFPGTSFLSQRKSCSALITLHPCIQEIVLAYLATCLEPSHSRQLLKNFFREFFLYTGFCRENDEFPLFSALINHCQRLLKLDQLSKNKLIINPQNHGYLKAEIGAFYALLQHFNQAQGYLAEALSALSDTSDPLTIQAMVYLGYVHRMSGKEFEARTLLEKALAYSSPLSSLKAWARSHLGGVYRHLGNYDKARALFLESLSFYQTNTPHSSKKIAPELIHLGEIYRLEGDLQKAKEFCEKGVNLYRQVLFHHSYDYGTSDAFPDNLNSHHGHADGDSRFFPTEISSRISWSLVQLGKIEQDRGEWKKAKSLFEQALQVLYPASLTASSVPELEEEAGCAWILTHLGKAESVLGNFQRAYTLLQRALVLYQKYFPQNKLKTAWVLIYLGHVDYQLKEFQRAEESLEKALRFLEEEPHEGRSSPWQSGKPSEIGQLFQELGQVYLQQKHLKKAEGSFQKALLLLSSQNFVQRVLCLEGLHSANQSAPSKNFLGQAWRICQESLPASSPIRERIQEKYQKNTPHNSIAALQSKGLGPP